MKNSHRRNCAREKVLTLWLQENWIEFFGIVSNWKIELIKSNIKKH